MTRRKVLAAAVTGAFAAERRNQAPVSRENLVVHLPEAAPVKLSNGVGVLAIEDNRLPIANVNIRVEGAGPIYSPRPGVAELTAEMLREGSTGRSGKQLIDEASRLGASLVTGAQSGAETASVDGSGLVSRFPEWLDLLADVLQRPGFPADEFSALRQRFVLANRRRASQASALVEDVLQSVTYGTHPAANVTPSSESLATLTPEMLAAWHRERYTPGNTMILCIGRVKPSALLARAEKVFGSWKGGPALSTVPPVPQRPASRRVVLIDRPGATQTELGIGALLFDRRDPDYLPATILFSVLGGSAGSRINRILREEKGYAFSANSTLSTPRFTGSWRVRAGVRADVSSESLNILLAELRRLMDEPIPAADLEEAKIGAIGRFAVNLEQPMQVITLSYLRYRYGFSVDYWERFSARLNAVTATEVQAVAQKYLDPARAHIIAAGDGAKIRPALAKLGPVELFAPTM